jgi:hypothetical protein
MAFDTTKALSIKTKLIRRQNRISIAPSFVDRFFPSSFGLGVVDRIELAAFSSPPFTLS